MAYRCVFTCSRAFTRPFKFNRPLENLIPPRCINHYSNKTNDEDFRIIEELLSKPIWSVESLLPAKNQETDAPKISSKQLHHLLRLSALPLPENEEEETRMLETLSAQLHFVGEIQRVDTTGVVPLSAIRDETLAHETAQTITLDTVKSTLDDEEVVGQHYKRIKTKRDEVNAKEVEDWDVLGHAERKVGRYFVVESERT